MNNRNMNALCRNMEKAGNNKDSGKLSSKNVNQLQRLFGKNTGAYFAQLVNANTAQKKQCSRTTTKMPPKSCRGVAKPKKPMKLSTKPRIMHIMDSSSKLARVAPRRTVQKSVDPQIAHLANQLEMLLVKPHNANTLVQRLNKTHI